MVMISKEILGKRQVTYAKSKTSSQPDFTLEDYIDEYYLAHGPYAPILHQCIDLARRLVFSTPGRDMAAQALPESWAPGCDIASSSKTQQVQKLYAEAAHQIQNFGEKQSIKLVVESRVQRGIQVLCEEPTTIWLSPDVR
jgi:hypothetical protein